MSSILTNSGAMVALQTLKGVNAGLQKAQSEIATGKRISSASDNAATWAISKVMEADVAGFKTISDSLALGASTVAVARQATETVTGLLTTMKEKIVAAQEPNVDRAKLQDDIDALKDQISAVVSAAQFNGLNLVNGTETSVNVLASLDRDTNGAVTSSSITVTAQDFSIGDYTANDIFDAGGGSAVVSGDGDTFVMSLDQGGGTDEITFQDGTTNWAVGDRVSLGVAGKTVTYTVSASDVDSGNNTIPDLIAVGLKSKIDALGIEGLVVDYDSASPGVLSFTNDGDIDVSVTGQFKNAGSGGFALMSTIDVTSDHVLSLANIETMLDDAINAAAAFGSVQNRISIQSDFVGQLTNSMKAGIGSLIDADMEETSARLQALQVQQQLGIQALSIANQAPQSILALFR